MLLGAVLVAIAVAAAGALWAHYARPRGVPPQDDCPAVAGLARDWIAMQQATTDPNSPGDRTALLALADRESAMADKIRAAKDSVSAQPIKDELEQWAQGAALSAQIQRDEANAPTDQPATAPEPATRVADMRRAAQLIAAATTALHKACPSMPVN